MLLPTRTHFLSSLRALQRKLHSHAEASLNSRSDHDGPPTLSSRLLDVFLRTWDLGFTAFGGPPVHFQILHKRFVEKEKWVDEQTYQELFAICQGLPGPASTKMLFCLALLHAGFIPAILVFALWCLPGAIGMYALSLGVQRIDETLPKPVYALLSGLNASTVGIIALAAVQLAEKAIRDRISRILVIFGACAGLCYSALWYFPVLMIAAGVATAVWDGWGVGVVRRVKKGWRERRMRRRTADGQGREGDGAAADIEMVDGPASAGGVSQVQTPTQGSDRLRMRKPDVGASTLPQTSADVSNASETEQPSQDHVIRVRVGAAIVVVFFASFIAIMVTRARLPSPPLTLSLFANMYLAGTVIFGGGPVVIPLLRSYVVDPGWVSSRDFLLGLAIIQAFPGPNFNFAVFLGALALRTTSHATIVGALLGAVGIFTPGLSLAVAMQSFWRVLRRKAYVINFLRGVNAAAVGLVFTAVYRLWEIGYLTPRESAGVSLAREPWWVVVAAVTYAEAAWFKVPPAVAIMVGAVLGLCWFGVVKPGGGAWDVSGMA
ncbi:chromate transporter-domain-containing protein [Aspergillus pseudodeflectus]|uniref:Chromate transporter-domain-containing protein n=1 Tax=Aspergillus pseudodeflectus TaxID=176178 RepID=A0ABR4JS05_9EURO